MSNQDQSSRWRGTYSEVHDLRAIGENWRNLITLHRAAPLGTPPPTPYSDRHFPSVPGQYQRPCGHHWRIFFTCTHRAGNRVDSSSKCQCYHATMAKPLNIYVRMICSKVSRYPKVWLPRFGDKWFLSWATAHGQLISSHGPHHHRPGPGSILN